MIITTTENNTGYRITELKGQASAIVVEAYAGNLLEDCAFYGAITRVYAVSGRGDAVGH